MKRPLIHLTPVCAALGLLASCGTSSVPNHPAPGDADVAQSGGEGGSGEGGSGDDAAPLTDAMSPDHDGSSSSSSSLDGGAAQLHGHVVYTVEDIGVGGSVVYVAPLDGSSAPVAVTSLTGTANTAKFSRDGRSVYYVNQLASGTEIRKVGVDGTNDHLVYGTCATYCYALGEDATGRVFVWNETGTAYDVGALYVVTPGDAGAPVLVPWAGDPGCSADANFDAAGDTIVFTTGCPSEHVFIGPSAATTPFTGVALTGAHVTLATEHVQLGGNRVFFRGWPLGTEAGSAVHVLLMARDGSDVQDLDVGEDAQDYVVSDDAGFVLVSYQTLASDASGALVSSIAAQIGGKRVPIPGLQVINTYAIVTLAWTAY